MLVLVNGIDLQMVVSQGRFSRIHVGPRNSYEAQVGGNIGLVKKEILFVLMQ